MPEEILKKNADWIKSEGGSPLAALIYCLGWLRGGRFSEDQMEADINQWEDSRGPVTWKSLSLWIEEVEMDATIVAPVVRRNWDA